MENKENMGNKKHFFDKYYGVDALSVFLILISILLNLITFLCPSGVFLYLGIPGILLLLLCVLRGISGDHEARERENEKFLDIVEPVFHAMDERTVRRAEEKEQKKIFKFFKCPSCHQKIRVPKGKGRIEITCPKCETRFIKKT